MTNNKVNLSRRQLVSILFTCGVAAGLVGWWLNTNPFGSSSYRPVPVELVYLDAARVDAYLGQLEHGLAASEKQSLSKTGAASATINAGGAVNIGASATSTESIERTVSPTEGDRFYDLLDQLHRRFASHFTRIDLPADSDASAEVRAIPEGDFVELQNARLVVPRFGLAAPALSLGAQSSDGVGKIPQSNLTTLIATYPKEIQAYLKGFGQNPTFPLSIESWRGQDKVQVPVLLTGLLNQPDLIGGDVTVLGVVVRQITGGRSHEPYQVEDKSYYDPASEVATERALLHAPVHVAKVLELPRGLADIETMLNQDGLLNPPATVVLPIAIYI